MRVGKGCERCRHRHIRCVIPDGAPACTSCVRLGQVCHIDPRFQFKAVHHVYQKNNGNPARFDLEWDTEQVWVDVTRPGTRCVPFLAYAAVGLILISVTFVLEASEGPRADARMAESGAFAPEKLSLLNTASEQEREDSASGIVPDGSRLQHRRREHHFEQATGSPTALSIDVTPTLSLREASLMRWFIQRIAPWVRGQSATFIETRWLTASHNRRISVTPDLISVRLSQGEPCRYLWYSRQYWH